MAYSSNRTNVWAILSIIFAFLCPILGIIFGIIALIQIGKSNMGGRGIAIAGIVIGAVFTIIPIVLFIIGGFFFLGFIMALVSQAEVNSCDVGDDFSCTHILVRPNGISLITLHNNMDKDITQGMLIIEDECTPNRFDIKAGEDITLTCKGSGGTDGKRYIKKMDLTYVIDDDEPVKLNTKGTIVARYQQ